MHENLLGLTYLSLLHGNTIGNPDCASAPFEIDLQDGYYKLVRNVVPTPLYPVCAKSTGIETPTVARIATSEFLSPSLYRVSVSFYDTAIAEEIRPEFRIHTAHILTPQTHRTMRYHINHATSPHI